MPRPNKRSSRTPRANGAQAIDLEKCLDALRALDRSVVETSMNVYKVSRRDRAAMLEQHRRLHELVRERLPQFLYQPEKDI